MAVLLVWGADKKNTALWLQGLRDRLLPLDAQ
jgi:hypothetical protein